MHRTMSAKTRKKYKTEDDKEEKDHPRLRRFSQIQFEKLCEIQCTKDEICSWFGTTDKSLENWVKRTYDGAGFSEVFEQKRKWGKVSLRRSQFRMARKNVAMAIFLGKQWLGQKDVFRSEHVGDGGGPIKTQGSPIDWTKFSVAQLEVVAKMMEQLKSDEGNKDSNGRDPKGSD